MSYSKHVYILLLLLPFTLTACTSSTTSSNYESEYYERDIPSTYRESSGYEEYGCTTDCFGHDAGYEWAEENGVTDSSECGGNSNSFIEGCESYASEYSGDSDDDYYDEDY